MVNNLFTTLFLSLSLSLSLFQQAKSYQTPQTVPTLITSSYLGNWIQIYGAPTNALFQGPGTCIAATYGLNQNNDTISVFNSQKSSLTNATETISGYAIIKNETDPGKLTVFLDGVPTPDGAPYWVVQLGPIINEAYQYSIITTESDISLWVLARNLTDFFENYDTDVQTYLNANYPHKVIQIDQTDC
jgi:lipocalin